VSASLVAPIIAFAILASFAFEVWLDLRQIRWLQRHRDAVPAVFAGQVSLTDHRRSVAYASERLRLSILDTVAGTVFALILLPGAGFAAIQTGIAGLVGTGYVAGLCLAGVVVALFAAIELPFMTWRTFHIEAKYGFNRTTPVLFLADLAKGAMLTAAIGAPFVLAIDAVLRNAGGQWWLAAWALYVGFNLVLLLIVPTWIMPLFNKFEPLGDAALKGRIEQLLARCGFRSGGLFQMDGSKRSGHGNAFFTGFGPSKRIVHFDTILASLSPSEIEAVLAHELGHFKRRHIVKRMVSQLFISFAIFALVGRVAGQDWFLGGLGLAPETATTMPLAGLILVLLAIPAFTGWFKGISNWRSRVHEFEADAYAAAQTSGADLAAALLKLHKDNASPNTTDPVYSTFKHTHPPTAERIVRLQSDRLQPAE
jgi:STE24 endopeptidase